MGEKIAFAHIEHAPTESLIDYLQTRVQRDMEFYEELQKVVKQPKPDNIAEFEDKYGGYAELTSGGHVDHHITVAAILSELKKRLARAT